MIIRTAQRAAVCALTAEEATSAFLIITVGLVNGWFIKLYAVSDTNTFCAVTD